MIRKHKCLFRTFVHFLLVFVSNRAGTWHLSFVTRSVETPNRGFVCCVLYCKCVGNCNGLATFFYSPRPSHIRFWQRKESSPIFGHFVQHSTQSNKLYNTAVTSKDTLLRIIVFLRRQFPTKSKQKKGWIITSRAWAELLDFEKEPPRHISTTSITQIETCLRKNFLDLVWETVCLPFSFSPPGVQKGRFRCE